MSNIVITDSTKYKEIINNFKNTTNKIDDIFKNENANLEGISGNDTWRCSLQEATYKKYNDLSVNYDTIIDSLNKLSNFMEKTIESYEKLDNTLNKDIQINENDLNVNS